MKLQHFKLVQWVSIIMCPGLSEQTNTVSCIWDGIATWRATRRKCFLSRTASYDEFLLSSNSSISAFIELIAVLIVIIATGLDCQGKNFLPFGNIPRIHRLINDVHCHKVRFRLFQGRPYTQIANAYKQRHDCFDIDNVGNFLGLIDSYQP